MNSWKHRRMDKTDMGDWVDTNADECIGRCIDE
jgi:hypothetical protein